MNRTPRQFAHLCQSRCHCSCGGGVGGRYTWQSPAPHAISACYRCGRLCHHTHLLATRQYCTNYAFVNVWGQARPRGLQHVPSACVSADLDLFPGHCCRCSLLMTLLFLFLLFLFFLFLLLMLFLKSWSLVLRRSCQGAVNFVRETVDYIPSCVLGSPPHDNRGFNGFCPKWYMLKRSCGHGPLAVTPSRLALIQARSRR